MARLKKNNDSKSVAVVATKAQGLVVSAAQMLGVDANPLTTKERRARAPFLRLDPAVIRLIGSVAVEHQPEVAHAIADGLAYEQAIAPVAQEARSLSSKIEDALLDRRAATAELAYASYQAMRGLVRMPSGAHLRPQVKEIEARLRRGKRKPKPPSAPAPTEPVATRPT